MIADPILIGSYRKRQHRTIPIGRFVRPLKTQIIRSSQTLFCKVNTLGSLAMSSGQWKLWSVCVNKRLIRHLAGLRCQLVGFVFVTDFNYSTLLIKNHAIPYCNNCPRVYNLFKRRMENIGEDTGTVEPKSPDTNLISCIKFTFQTYCPYLIFELPVYSLRTWHETYSHQA